MSKETKVLIGLLVAIVGGMLALFFFTGGNDSSGGNAEDSATKLISSNTYKTGSGPIQLVEFSDYQCPSCAAIQPVVAQIMKEYEGKVTLYWRDFPLDQHKNSRLSANAAYKAGDLGKFWEMNAMIFANQKDWQDLDKEAAAAKFGEYATSLGVDGEKVKQAALSDAYKSILDKGRSDGAALGIEGTPTFFVNGKMTTGPAYPQLRDAIEAALKNQ